MHVYLTIPSKRPAPEAQACIDSWRAQGYRVAIWRDLGDELVDCDLLLTGEYEGYARAVNALMLEVIARDLDAAWLIAAGDDTLPDMTKTATEIARECSTHFGGTFGVMQPTADGHGIESIAGSPWIGRTYAETVNGGHGPLWYEYEHMFGDNECKDVAELLGVYWQRPDLTHKHEHWTWTGDRKMPKFLTAANSPEHWNRFLALYRDRRAAGFPGHHPLKVAA